MKTKTIAYIGISVALALILSFFKVFRMPQGGDVSLDMVPLIILALARGFFPGLIGGVLFGILHLMQGGFVVHPVQMLLDYPVAFGCLGIAGLFAPMGLRNSKNIITIYAGITLAVFLRFICHCMSGYVFFSSYAPQGAVLWIYVAAYNASYLIPELIIVWLTVPFIYKRIKQY